MKNLKKKIFVNTLSGWFYKIIAIIYYFIITPILFSRLGQERYGIWVVIGQFLSYLMLFDLGISNSIARFYSKNLALKDKDKNASLINTALFLFLTISIFILFFITIFHSRIISFLNISDVYQKEADISLCIAGLILVLIFPLRIFRGILQTYYEYYYIDLFGTITYTLKLIFLILFLNRFNQNLIVLSIIVFGGNLFYEMSITCRSIYKSKFKLNFKLFSVQYLKEIFSLGSSLFVITMTVALRYQAMIILISKFIGVAKIPILSIPYMIIRHIGGFIARIGGLLTPMASYFDAQNDKDKMAAMSIDITKYSLMISFSIVLYIMFYGKYFLSWWLKDTVTSTTLFQMQQILIILTIPYFICVSNTGIKSVLNSVGRHKQVSFLNLAITIIGFTWLIITLYISKIEIIHFAVALSLIYVLLSIAYLILISAYLKRGIFLVFNKIYIKPLVFLIIMIGVFFLVNKFISKEDISSIVISIGVLLTLNIILFYLFIDDKYKRVLKEKFRKGMVL